MSVSDGFLTYVSEQLEKVTAPTTKKMFGGVGVYADGVFIALISSDELYFKTDESNRHKFEARGMVRFRPYGDKRSMSYYQVPADVLEDEEQLDEWVRDAVAAAIASKKPRKRSKKS